MANDAFLPWDSPEWDGLDWDNEWSQPAPALRPRPWYTNTRVLGAAIAIASAVFVVSTVLLMTSSPGDFRTDPLIRKVTPTATPTEMTAPTHAPVTSARTSSAPSTTEAPATTEEAGPIGRPSTTSQSAPVAVPHPQHSAAPTAEMPHLPLSRSPMSFTPSPVPRH